MKESILEKYREVKKSGTKEELKELANNVISCEEIQQNDKKNMLDVLGTTYFRKYNEQLIEKKKEEKPINKIELDVEFIDNIIDETIDSIGEDGRIDADCNLDNFYSLLYSKFEDKIDAELSDDDCDKINEELGKFYKDGFYVAKESFSLKEYEERMYETMEKVDDILDSLGFEITISRSIYGGLLASRYYKKNDIEIRVGDHKNSNGSDASFSRNEFYNMSAEEIANYVLTEYNKKSGGNDEF